MSTEDQMRDEIRNSPTEEKVDSTFDAVYKEYEAKADKKKSKSLLPTTDQRFMVSSPEWDLKQAPHADRKPYGERYEEQGDCDRCDKKNVPVKPTPDGDGPFCGECYKYMTKHNDYTKDEETKKMEEEVKKMEEELKEEEMMRVDENGETTKFEEMMILGTDGETTKFEEGVLLVDENGEALKFEEVPMMVDENGEALKWEEIMMTDSDSGEAMKWEEAKKKGKAVNPWAIANSKGLKQGTKEFEKVVMGIKKSNKIKKEEEQDQLAGTGSMGSMPYQRPPPNQVSQVDKPNEAITPFVSEERYRRRREEPPQDSGRDDLSEISRDIESRGGGQDSEGPMMGPEGFEGQSDDDDDFDGALLTGGNDKDISNARGRDAERDTNETSESSDMDSQLDQQILDVLDEIKDQLANLPDDIVAEVEKFVNGESDDTDIDDDIDESGEGDEKEFPESPDDIEGMESPDDTMDSGIGAPEDSFSDVPGESDDSKNGPKGKGGSLIDAQTPPGPSGEEESKHEASASSGHGLRDQVRDAKLEEVDPRFRVVDLILKSYPREQRTSIFDEIMEGKKKVSEEYDRAIQHWEEQIGNAKANGWANVIPYYKVLREELKQAAYETHNHRKGGKGKKGEEGPQQKPYGWYDAEGECGLCDFVGKREEVEDHIRTSHSEEGAGGAMDVMEWNTEDNEGAEGTDKLEFEEDMGRGTSMMMPDGEVTASEETDNDSAEIGQMGGGLGQAVGDIASGVGNAVETATKVAPLLMEEPESQEVGLGDDFTHGKGVQQTSQFSGSPFESEVEDRGDHWRINILPDEQVSSMKEEGSPADSSRLSSVYKIPVDKGVSGEVGAYFDEVGDGYEDLKSLDFDKGTFPSTDAVEVWFIGQKPQKMEAALLTDQFRLGESAVRGFCRHTKKLIDLGTIHLLCCTKTQKPVAIRTDASLTPEQSTQLILDAAEEVNVFVTNKAISSPYLAKFVSVLT